MKLDTRQLSFELLKSIAVDLTEFGPEVLTVKTMDEARTMAHELATSLLSILDEETTAYAELPYEMADVCMWIALTCISNCTSFSPTGRKELRAKLIDFFNNGIKSPPESVPSPECPAPQLPPGPQMHPSDVPRVDRSDITDNMLVKASQRAEQLIKPAAIIAFDGLHSPERYFVFKSEVEDVISACGSIEWLVPIEILMGSLKGPALTLCRKTVTSHDVYRMGRDGLVLLWSVLDREYSTPEASRHVSELFASCKQAKAESLPAYVARFQKIADTRQADGTKLNDSELIVRLSCGIQSKVGIIARGITDALRIQRFNEYVLTLIATSKSMANVIQDDVPNNAMRPTNQNRNPPKKPTIGSCARCGESAHTTPSCTRKVKYPCRICTSTDHFTRVCPKMVSTPPPLVPLDSPVDPVASALFDMATTRNSSMRIDMAQISIANPQLIDHIDPEIPVFIEGPEIITQQCLLDSGAGANFIRKSVAESLVKSGCIQKHQIHTLSQPVCVTYGNSTVEKLGCYVSMRIRVPESSSQFVDVSCFVSENSSYGFILGRPGLRAIKLMPITFPHQNLDSSLTKVENSAHTITPTSNRSPMVEVTTGNRLQIRYPLLEQAHISPYRAPKRARSGIDMQIILAKLHQMCDEDKVTSCESRDCHLVHEIVLVDKWVHKKIPRVYPDPDPANDRLQRYRITLDLRVGNDLQLINFGSFNGFVPNRQATVAKPVAHPDDHQHQAGALDIIKQLPAGGSAFAKIDLVDAYQSVLLPPQLRGLFCFSIPTVDGVKFYQWNTVPQGWKWSSLFFQVAVQFVLDRTKAELKNVSAYAWHYQDDILIQASSNNDVTAACDVIISNLLRFGFEVNRTKTTISDTMVFCGYHLSASGVSPLPKCPITEQFASLAWNKYLETSSTQSKLGILRSWSGKFNYLLGYLSPPQLSNLRCIYSAISDTHHDKDVDLESLHSAFTSLCDYVVQGIPKFPIGLVADTVCTIIVTDANRDAYAGIILRVCIKNLDTPGVAHTVDDVKLLELIVHDLHLENPLERLVLIPVRITGGKFTPGEQKQSSTYRERLCQIRCVDELYHLIQGICIMISDNQNVGKNWHSIDEMLSYGSCMTLWVRFIATVRSTLWISRDSDSIILVDYLARLIGSQPICSLQAINVATADVSLSDSVVRSESRARFPRLALPLRAALVDQYINDTSNYLHIEMKDVHQFLAHGSTADRRIEHISRRFSLHDGLLYRVRLSGAFQVYIPTGGDVEIHTDVRGSIRACVLHHYHDSAIGLHRGYEKLVVEVSSHFWWPTLLRDCLTYVKTCAYCNKAKMRFTKFKGDIKSIQVDQALSSWVIDYAGPFRDVTRLHENIGSGSNEKYILVCVCVYSAYVVIVPTIDCTAETTSRAIIQFIVGPFGIPNNIYSDRGRSFDNELISKMQQSLKICWRMSASYSPRTQGLAERLIGHMKSAFQSMNSDWSVLPYIQLFHNSSCVGGIKMSPFEVVFGQRARTSPILEEVYPDQLSDDLTVRREQIKVEWMTFRNHVRERYSDAYASKSAKVQFLPNDSVMRTFLVAGIGRSVITTGPHRILKAVMSSNCYEISGYSYPIPEYQLSISQARPPDLSTTTPEDVEAEPSYIDREQVKVGSLILFETFEANSIVYDVGKICSVSDDELTVNRYWYDTHSRWQLWKDEFVKVLKAQIVVCPLVLINKKVPPSILNGLGID